MLEKGPGSFLASAVDHFRYVDSRAVYWSIKSFHDISRYGIVHIGIHIDTYLCFIHSRAFKLFNLFNEIYKNGHYWLDTTGKVQFLACVLATLTVFHAFVGHKLIFFSHKCHIVCYFGKGSHSCRITHLVTGVAVSYQYDSYQGFSHHGYGMHWWIITPLVDPVSVGFTC